MYNKILISVILLYMSVDYALQDGLEFNRHWDMFILSQRWPTTVCKIYKNSSTEHECNFPKQNNLWTTHGLWPERLGEKDIYPIRCNESSGFDPEQIKSISSDLTEGWTNILKDKDPDPMTYWNRQWLNHGTCAQTVEDVNSQLKYFQKGLELNKKYRIYEMLSAASILPDDSKEVKTEELSKAVEAQLGQQPVSVCRYDKAGTQYLQELYLCFDKQFNLIECDGFITIRGIKTNCDVSLGIIYPKTPTQ